MMNPLFFIIGFLVLAHPHILIGLGLLILLKATITTVIR